MGGRGGGGVERQREVEMGGRGGGGVDEMGVGGEEREGVMT